MTEYYGKYRGLVMNNIDPMQLGRLLVACPQVLGPAQGWAMPCVPFASGPIGPEGLYTLPLPGSNVWVEFEHGDPNLPIWSGGFWDSSKKPPSNTTSPTVRTVIKTLSTELTLDDALGITLKFAPPGSPMPCAVLLGPTGIEISMGPKSIKISALSVTINDGALEVL